MRAYERLLNYVKIHTASAEDKSCVPSFEGEFDLANLLADEMKALGLEDVRVDEHSYAYGVIPASKGYEDKTCVGFIAHIDTIPGFSGKDVKPAVYENYDAGI